MTTEKNTDWISIDGSMGEGGGQVLRTALSLSLITGQSFRIDNIRANRKKPGLLRQHYTAANAAAQIGCAQVEGLAVGSRELSFRPQTIQGGAHEFSVGTAGSVHLVLQTILPALLMADEPSTVSIEGGTHNPLAPPFDFVERTFLPVLKRMGGIASVTLERPGFFPGGGGLIRASIKPVERFKRLELTAPVLKVRKKATIYSGKIRTSVAEREMKTLMRKLKLQPDEVATRDIPNSLSPGNVLSIALESDEVTEIVTGFGARGVKAETVAKRAAKEAIRYMEAEVPVGEHLADQLLLPMAIGKGGCFHTVEPSLHFRTNIEVIQLFLDVNVVLTQISDRGWKVEVGH
jgi:RNA 3'-terminal phosphate cyclase (ATP)